MQMHIAVQGALVGLVIAIALMVFEWMSIKSEIAERSKKIHRQATIDATEEKRLHSLWRFCIILPPIFAFAAWAIWG